MKTAGAVEIAVVVVVVEEMLVADIQYFVVATAPVVVVAADNNIAVDLVEDKNIAVEDNIAVITIMLQRKFVNKHETAFFLPSLFKQDLLITKIYTTIRKK